MSTLTRDGKAGVTFLEEAEKCVLLCCRCHREVHAGEAVVPEDFTRFNRAIYDSFEVSRPVKLCTACGKEFSLRGRKCCSLDCANKQVQLMRQSLCPSKEELSIIAGRVPMTQIAKRYGVSSNTIKSWLMKFGLNTPGRGMWTKQIRNTGGGALVP